VGEGELRVRPSEGVNRVEWTRGGPSLSLSRSSFLAEPCLALSLLFSCKHFRKKKDRVESGRRKNIIRREGRGVVNL
jgi:hypothetical protein